MSKEVGCLARIRAAISLRSLSPQTSVAPQAPAALPS
jgi:hypothetical protein